MFVEAINTASTVVSSYELSKKAVPLFSSIVRRIKNGKLNIVIAGAGGTGKSTLGKILAGDFGLENIQQDLWWANRSRVQDYYQTSFYVIFSLLVLMMASLSMFYAPRIEANKNRMPTKIVRMINLLEEDTRTIADKLEKVMRVTIEVQDQIEINLARKLELDLRIGDAQSALEYYYSVIGTR